MTACDRVGLADDQAGLRLPRRRLPLGEGDLRLDDFAVDAGRDRRRRCRRARRRRRRRPGRSSWVPNSSPTIVRGFQLWLPPASSMLRSRSNVSPAAFGSTVNSLPSCLSTTSSPTCGLSSRSTASRASPGDMPLTSTPPIVAFAGIRRPVMMKPTTYSTPSTRSAPIRARRICRRDGGAPALSSVGSVAVLGREPGRRVVLFVR